MGEHDEGERSTRMTDPRTPAGDRSRSGDAPSSARESALAAINDATREMIGASERRICELAAETVDEAMRIDVASVWLFDSAGEGLDPAATVATDDFGDDVESVFDRIEERAWQTFVEGEPFVCTDVRSREDLSFDGRIGGLVLLPLGRHGLLFAACGSTEANCPCSSETLCTLASNTEAALDRTQYERELQRQERRLAEQNETLDRVNRINDVIRDIATAIVEASTREGIEAVVCERLTESDPYLFAWIGEYDAASGQLVAREWAGVADGYLEAVLEGSDGWVPAEQAVETNEPQVVTNVLDDDRFAEWHRDALTQGFQSCIAVPLVYDGARYGVLNVCAEHPDVFDETERDVLVELGEIIAHAMNARRSKRALVADAVTEVLLRTDDGGVLGTLAEEIGAPVELLHAVPHDGDRSVLYVTCGAGGETARAAAVELPGVHDLRVVSDDGDEAVVELVTDGSELATTVVEQGGSPRAVVAEDGTTRVRVELPDDADVRSFVDHVAAAYPEIELQGRRARDRPVQAPGEFSAAVEESLTDRQREVLAAAYSAGYFEWPRDSNGEELADALDVTQPTVLRHLRVGQRKLLAALFDDGLDT